MAVNKQLANTQDLVEIEEIKENTVFLKNGGLRQVVMVSGVNTALLAEQEIEALSAGYINFLNGLDFQIQIIVHSRKVNIEHYLSGLESRIKDEPSALLQSQIKEYQEFIGGFVRENSIMEKSFLVVIPFSPIMVSGKDAMSSISKFLPFLNKGNKDTKRAEDDAGLKENLEQLTQRTTQVVEGLSVMGLEAIPLENQALVELFYNFYNPETTERDIENIEEMEVMKHKE